ncbi:MAG: TIGR03986 family CRISPR-associated RAMP protein [Leptospiraceae bacterium]|nr:TIGR03986 family CRISPR-associated RAMP protein [Leptospiraceae bacterium]
MEKGKLIVTKGKTGLYAQIALENGKIMASVGFKPTDPSLNNKEIEFERVNGIITKIVCEGKLIFEKSEIEKQQKQIIQTQKQTQGYYQKQIPAWQSSKQSNKQPTVSNQYGAKKGAYELPSGTAQAPYNFIPLNHQVAEIKELPFFDKYHEHRLTGYIKLHVESETPLYIRDSLTIDDIKKQIEDNKKNQRFIHSDFYSPTGKLAIPGSSMRGMIRNLVEITSFGHFGFYNNTRLYFRALADTTNLKQEYSDKMSSWDKKTKLSQYKMLAGILRMKNQFEFEIIPVGGFKEGFDSIPKYASKQILSELERKEKNEKETFKYGTFRTYWIEDKKEYIVVSGDMGNKKRDWIVRTTPYPNQTTIRLNEKDIEDYMNDSNRMAINLIYELRMAKIQKEKDAMTTSNSDIENEVKKYGRVVYDRNGFLEIPCFYTAYTYNTQEDNEELDKNENGNTRIAFGHTPMFRLPYEKKIVDLIPEHLKKKPEIKWNSEREEFEIQNLDYADAIFGFTLEKQKEKDLLKALSSRVYFTDVVDGKATQLMEVVPKALSGPKPTTFQHYVSQNGMEEIRFEGGGKAIKNRNHYNTAGNTEIRGNKLYWHKDAKGSHWQEGNGDSEIQKKLIDKIRNNEEKIHTIIKPAPEKTTFAGKIYFENLSEQELGALLFALNLPEGCTHKIGMGKSLGLGSIKITPTLFLSNKKERYASLASGWKKEDAKEEPDYLVKKYIEIFSNDILNQIGEKNNHKDLWETERLQELKTLLQKQDSETQRKFRYMEIERETNQINPNTGRPKKFNEFRERPILSQPTKYIKGK